jgi:hypothetical protein
MLVLGVEDGGDDQDQGPDDISGDEGRTRLRAGCKWFLLLLHLPSVFTLYLNKRADEKSNTVLSEQESRTYTADLVINEEYLLEALCYDLAVEHPQAILIQGHRAFQQVRRKSTARNIVNSNNNNSTPTGSTEGNQTPASFLSSTPGQGGKTPGSTLGGRTPGSNLGNKTPGSALGSVMDMDMDSPLPRHANFIGDKPNGGGGQKEDGELDGDAKLSEEEGEEVLLDLATEILMAT